MAVHTVATPTTAQYISTIKSRRDFFNNEPFYQLYRIVRHQIENQRSDVAIQTSNFEVVITFRPFVLDTKENFRIFSTKVMDPKVTTSEKILSN